MNGTPFILQGRDHVLAHPNLAARAAEPARGGFLPALDGVGDPALDEIWAPGGVEIVSTTTRAHRVRAVAITDYGGHEHLFVYGTIEDYGGPWLVGSHYLLDKMDDQIDRLSRATLAGAAVLILAILAALAMSRWLGRPIRRLAHAAESVRDLDFGQSGQAMGSTIRELDDAARAFNQMLAGLRWFETYVPRALVMRLLHESEAQRTL
jgi:HAMP domain-containing protein